jgi:hypothetical protein
MRSFLLGAVGCLALGAPLRAQEPVQNYAGVTSYVLSFPTGDSRDLVTTPSWIGISWEGVWALGERTTAGIAFSVHDFNHGFTGTAHYPWGAATGQQSKNLTMTTAMLTGRWYPLAERTRRPHVGLAAGVVYSEETYRLALSQIEHGAAHFAVAPEVGWQFPIVNGIDGLVSARYTFPSRTGDYVGGARSYPFATLGFGILER